MLIPLEVCQRLLNTVLRVAVTMASDCVKSSSCGLLTHVRSTISPFCSRRCVFLDTMGETRIMYWGISENTIPKTVLCTCDRQTVQKPSHENICGMLSSIVVGSLDVIKKQNKLLPLTPSQALFRLSWRD